MVVHVRACMCMCVGNACVRACMCMCVGNACVRACVRACVVYVRACVCGVCVRVCVCARARACVRGEEKRLTEEKLNVSVHVTSITGRGARQN